MPNKRLGYFEEVILRIVAWQKGIGYGASIVKELNERLAKYSQEATPGAMYTTLKRLQTKGYLVSSWSESISVRGGRKKKYYTITDDGQRALDRMSASREPGDG